MMLLAFGHQFPSGAYATFGVKLIVRVVVALECYLWGYSERSKSNTLGTRPQEFW